MVIFISEPQVTEYVNYESKMWDLINNKEELMERLDNLPQNLREAMALIEGMIKRDLMPVAVARTIEWLILHHDE